MISRQFPAGGMRPDLAHRGDGVLTLLLAHPEGVGQTCLKAIPELTRAVSYHAGISSNSRAYRAAGLDARKDHVTCPLSGSNAGLTLQFNIADRVAVQMN